MQENYWRNKQILQSSSSKTFQTLPAKVIETLHCRTSEIWYLKDCQIVEFLRGMMWFLPDAPCNQTRNAYQNPSFHPLLRLVVAFPKAILANISMGRNECGSSHQWTVWILWYTLHSTAVSMKGRWNDGQNVSADWLKCEKLPKNISWRGHRSSLPSLTTKGATTQGINPNRFLKRVNVRGCHLYSSGSFSLEPPAEYQQGSAACWDSDAGCQKSPSFLLTGGHKTKMSC